MSIQISALISTVNRQVKLKLIFSIYEEVKPFRVGMLNLSTPIFRMAEVIQKE